MRMFQVDAFAGELFHGNPAAVVPLEAWLPEGLMQQIAMENNLAETAFFVPHGKGFLLRWFTPTVEVALCGHATLASTHVLFGHLGYGTNPVVFHTLQSGDLRAKRDGPNRYTLDFPETPAFQVDFAPLGVLFESLNVPAAPVLKGPFDYLVVLDSEKAVEELQPDFKRLATVPCRGVVVTAPGDRSDFVSRCFFPQTGIDEDPVTGSAHTMTVPYWAKRLGKSRLFAIQLSARRGYLECQLLGDRVLMTGEARTFLQGEILL
ncbi:MAG TPA: PhzF family phenazine biosynthesis protein [Puia sp.]|nr:PhzF family phenazine biosynthesis protein [Puia sp.]